MRQEVQCKGRLGHYYMSKWPGTNAWCRPWHQHWLLLRLSMHSCVFMPHGKQVLGFTVEYHIWQNVCKGQLSSHVAKSMHLLATLPIKCLRHIMLTHTILSSNNIMNNKPTFCSCLSCLLRPHTTAIMFHKLRIYRHHIQLSDGLEMSLNLRPSYVDVSSSSQAGFHQPISPSYSYSATGGSGSDPGLSADPQRRRVGPGSTCDHYSTMGGAASCRSRGILRCSSCRARWLIHCSSCKATQSPEWHKGPNGMKELCNA